MATKVETLTLCDAASSKAGCLQEGDHHAPHVVRITIDGRTYETDLCTHAAAALSAAVEDWTANSRPVTLAYTLSPAGARSAARRGTQALVQRTPSGRISRSAAERREVTAIRAWAASRGLPLAQRGRIPETIRTAYERDTSTPAPSRAAVPALPF